LFILDHQVHGTFLCPLAYLQRALSPNKENYQFNFRTNE
jgi:hypothetical protein